MKLLWAMKTETSSIVTPLAGVWIEINGMNYDDFASAVTPLAGVWIEIGVPYEPIGFLESLPLRECGLKYVISYLLYDTTSHSPCGSVD